MLKTSLRLGSVTTLLAGLALLSGCASSPTMPDGSAIELGRKIMKEVQPPVGLVVTTVLQPPPPNDRGSFWMHRQSVCGADRRALARANRPIWDLCRAKGGVFEHGFCRTAGDGDDVKFMARFQEGDLRGCTVLVTAEPKPGADGSDFLNYLVEQGYKTAARRRDEARTALERTQAVEARQAQERQAEQMRRRAALARVAVELPIMKKRGTKVCKDDGERVFVGFVEDFTDEKLKVLLIGGHMAGSRLLEFEVPVGTIHWDNFIAWRLC